MLAKPRRSSCSTAHWRDGARASHSWWRPVSSSTSRRTVSMRSGWPRIARISFSSLPLALRRSPPATGTVLDQPFEGEGAEWDRSFGRTDTSSLKIDTQDDGLTRWQTFQGDGEGYFAEPWTPCKGYRVSCYVKTENVTGRGSTLAVQYHVPNSRQVFPVLTARKITGTSDWTRLEITVGPPDPSPPDVFID